MAEDTEIENLRKSSEKYAELKGCKLNPNKEIVDVVLKGLIKNQEKLGKRFCPCVRPKLDGNDRVCPCKPSAKEIETQGYCHCMLYFRKDFELDTGAEE